jgi:hypothetical protein
MVCVTPPAAIAPETSALSANETAKLKPGSGFEIFSAGNVM